MEEQDSPRLGFVPSRFPWLVAAAALILYLVTLNGWVTLGSITMAAKITGWDWNPELNAPIHFLITYPCRLIPAAWQLPVLNACSAIFAALALALLARSVALLPHDRTSEQRVREPDDFSLLSIKLAWVPPLLAVLVCGLQLSFWENATAATGEMLDLLLFAYAIRCVLEYRIDERDVWLNKLALVYGLGVTNNWALIGFFPLFVLALVWIRGRAFFQLGFILRMLGLGAAGLLLYLCLPLLAVLADSELSFRKLLLTELSNQKLFLLGFPRSLALVLALTSILPVIIIGIRWPSSFGDTSIVGSFFTNLMFRLVHIMFLGACLWLMFDPGFSPRVLGNGIPFLSFYYLGALSIGYFSGYFLLLAREPGGRARARQSSHGGQLLNKVLAGLVLGAAVAAPVGLVLKNLPVIRALNGPALQTYAKQLSETVPSSDAVILADNPYLLYLVQAARHQSGDVQPNVFVDTRIVNFALYQIRLNRLHPKLWPALPITTKPLDTLDPGFLSQQIFWLADSREVHYLHPSFGYFFERVYLQPQGLTYRVFPHGTNTLAAPPMAQADLDRTEQWFAKQEATWRDLAAFAKLDFPTARAVGQWYSRGLNYWGTELQKHGRLEDAAKRFTQAVAANTNNVAASVNLRFNQGLRAGRPEPIPVDKDLERTCSEFGGMDALLTAYGPFDEPNLCFRQGRVFSQNSLNRQAALAFRRSLTLDPSNIRASIEFASACILGEAWEEAQQAIAQARQQPGRTLLPGDDIDLERLAALVWSSRGDVAKAEEILQALRRKYPQQEGPLASLGDLYVSTERFKEALQAIDDQLAISPDNLLARFRRGTLCMRLEAYDEAQASFDFILRKQPGNLEALMNKAVVFIQLKKPQEAIPILDDILRSQPEHRAALMNRAIACLQHDQLDQALRDYRRLEKLFPNSHVVYYGLGTIAWKRKDSAEAIRQYERYLELLAKNMPGAPPTDEAKDVQSRLQELKAERR